MVNPRAFLVQALFFREPGDLLRCLRAVCDDPAVRVARLTNRLHAGHDPTATAGYRDVRVNLCLASAAARELGLDGVVCELQLGLVDFARLRVPAMPCPLRGCTVMSPLCSPSSLPCSALLAQAMDGHLFIPPFLLFGCLGCAFSMI